MVKHPAPHPCPVCHHPCSRLARICPACGHPLTPPNGEGFTVAATLLLIAGTLLAVIGAYWADQNVYGRFPWDSAYGATANAIEEIEQGLDALIYLFSAALLIGLGCFLLIAKWLRR